MTAPEPDGVAWRTSSYSAESGGCVEVGWHTSSDGIAPTPDHVLVRDSKNPNGPVLGVPAATWWALLSTVSR